MSINGKEIVSVVNLIANEKQINKELVFESLESSLAVSLRKDYGKTSLKVKLDRTNGNMTVELHQVVVADVDYEDDTQIKLSEAKALKSDAVIGDVIVTELPSKDLSRVNAQVFKQVMKQNFKQAERKGAEEHYKDLIGKIYYATVKKVMKNDALVVIDEDVEGLLPLSDANGYHLKPGGKVRVVLERIEAQKSHQLIFSRSSDMYLKAVLTKEIPAIGDENIDIVAIARIKGKRSKVVVKGRIAHIDEMRECIGPKGTRVKEVVNSMNGEQIDFVVYDADLGTYISNIMEPIKISRVVIDEADNSVHIIVKDEVVEKYGNMIKNNEELARQLLSKKVIVETEGKYEEIQSIKDTNSVQLFMDELNVDEDLAAILVEEGFDSIEAVAYAPMDVFLEIEGFDEELVLVLREAANKSIKQYAESDLNSLKTMKVGYLKTLVEAGITTLSDLADLATDELLDVLNVSRKEAEEMILEARSVGEEKLNSLDVLKTVKAKHKDALVKSGVSNRDELAELATDELLEILKISKKEAEEMILEAREHWFQ